MKAGRSDCSARSISLLASVGRGQAGTAARGFRLGLRCGAHGIKGTYAVPYGSKMEPLDAEMVRRLNARKP